MEKPKAVRLQCKTVRGYEHYYVTVPNDVVGNMGWEKGEILFVKIVEVDVDGKKVKGILYYKP